jgi:hypothetical protein
MRTRTVRIACTLFAFALAAPSARAGGSATLRAGYLFLDEEGNRAVNLATQNLYEGVVVSLESIRWRADNGIRLEGDLRRVTLENRDLSLRLYRPRWFSLSFHDDKSRRLYRSPGFSGAALKRENLGGALEVRPTEWLKLTGSVKRTHREGRRPPLFFDTGEPVWVDHDYDWLRTRGGVELFHDGRSLRVELSRSDFTDKGSDPHDREATMLRLDAASPLPRWHRLVMAGGYLFRRDRLVAEDLEIRTHQGWGALRVALPRGFGLEYRLVFARTQDDPAARETDNVLNTIVASKRWRRAGLRVGWENRIADDLEYARTESNGLLLSGWARPVLDLSIRGSYAWRNEDVPTGNRLLGEESRDRARLVVRWRIPKWGSWGAEYTNRHLENPDIGSETDYRSIATRFVLSRSELGELRLYYAYFSGTNSNALAEDFEFSDHLVRASVARSFQEKLRVEAGIAWLMSRRRVDMEKLAVELAAVYRLPRDFEATARFNGFEYDNYLRTDEYYTGNVFELTLARPFTF